MNIAVLPPDINEGESGFSVSGGGIRYGLSAIKSVGKPVVDAILEERAKNGKFCTMEDFINRMTQREVNRRTLENFIKSGALDSLPGTRRQKMAVGPALLENKARERKNAFEGQLSLFDIAGEEEKKEFEVVFPDVGEYAKEELLAFEKEVLGIYVSGHPLEKYEDLWRGVITNVTSDFALDEETGRPKVVDGSKAVIGGMITAKTVKYTKTNKTMAFLTVEDLVGTVEVVVFPKDYEKNQQWMNEDEKVFIRGRVNNEDDRPSKLICEKIWRFEEVPMELWIQFSDMETYRTREQELFGVLRDSGDGSDYVAIYVRNPRSVRKLGENWTVRADEAMMAKLAAMFGKENVRLTRKKE